MKYEPITEFSPERCEILAQTIERQPHARFSAFQDANETHSGFSMIKATHKCGSPCCIGGWAGSLLGTDSENWFWSDIRDFLGCTAGEAVDLYWGYFIDKAIENITPQEAAAAVRSLIEKRKTAQ